MPILGWGFTELFLVGPLIVVVVAVVLFLVRFARRAKAFGYESTSAYLRAVPREASPAPTLDGEAAGRRGKDAGNDRPGRPCIVSRRWAWPPHQPYNSRPVASAIVPVAVVGSGTPPVTMS